MALVLILLGFATFVGGAWIERQNRINARRNRGRVTGIGAHGALPDTDMLSRMIMSITAFALMGSGVLLILWGILRLFGVF